MINKILVGLLCLVLLLIPIKLVVKQKQPEPIKNEMCLEGIYTENFSFQESIAGEYKYEIYATQHGTELWVECDKE